MIPIDNAITTDFAVVGSGAGGASAFAHLARSGKNVMLLEEGSRYDPDYFTKSITTATLNLYRNAGLSPIIGRPVIPFGEGRCLGGTTEINGGLIWRTPDWVRRDWNQRLGLDEVFGSVLDPHFAAIENRLGVSSTGLNAQGNRDSELLRIGAEKLGWLTSFVPRAAARCKNSNRCGSGCPTAAKQSMSLTLIPDGESHGGQVLTGLRVERIKRRSGKVLELHCSSTNDNKLITIAAKTIIVAGGSTQSPLILSRSGLTPRKSTFCFHTNLKILAEFDEAVDATNGTILTCQVQEFAKQRSLIMATNLTPEYLAMSYSDLGFARLSTIVDRIDRFALYTVQVAPQSRGQMISVSDSSYMFHRLSKLDFDEIKINLIRCVHILFAAGARSLYLPILGHHLVRSKAEAIETIKGSAAKLLKIASVHAMSSIPMGINSANSRVRPDGRLWNENGIYVVDGSILPSWTIESPQGTIMATSSLLTTRIAESL
jgi:choline dehydrogenase-like flavoprotein